MFTLKQMKYTIDSPAEFEWSMSTSKGFYFLRTDITGYSPLQTKHIRCCFPLQSYHEHTYNVRTFITSYLASMFCSLVS